jgi:hypothetical protein
MKGMNSKSHVTGLSLRLEFKIKQKTSELLELIKKKTLGGNIYYNPE